MDPKLLFPLLAVGFGLAAGWRVRKRGSLNDPAARTWLIVAVLFGAVSIWSYQPG